jgi:transcriptional regulator with XRE-family HTH domain
MEDQQLAELLGLSEHTGDVEQPERPALALGRFLKSVRIAKGKTQREVAKLSGIPYPTVSLMEKGRNVEIMQYERFAKACGYRNALEMIRAGGDPLTRRLLRLWHALDDDDEARRDVLDQIERSIVRSEE